MQIIEILIDKGYTQAEISRRMGYSRFLINNVKKGRKRPTLDFYLRLKDGFPDLELEKYVTLNDVLESFREVSQTQK